MNGSSSTDAAAAAQADGTVGAAPGELHPGGMLVQNRSDAVSGPRGNLVKIKVLRGSHFLDVSVPAESTFGELKKVLEKETGLEPHEQRLLFRGKEKDDDGYLHMAGIKDMSKVVLLEDPVSKARKFEQMKRDLDMKKAYDAIAAVRAEVDKLTTKVSALEAAVHSSTKADAKDFAVLTELLMMQLLKLDGIDAEGEAKMQRKSECCASSFTAGAASTTMNLQVKDSKGFVAFANHAQPLPCEGCDAGSNFYSYLISSGNLHWLLRWHHRHHCHVIWRSLKRQCLMNFQC